MKIIIIGGGPAGIESAIVGSRLSNDVTLISDSRIGDWKSTLPNLWLINVNEIREKKTFALTSLEARKNSWRDELKHQLNQANVKILKGKATFQTCSKLKVANAEEETYIYGEKIIIANGSRPVFPRKVKADGKRIFSYQNLSILEEIPSSIIVIGDSPIGYEMVNLFLQVGSKVKWLLPTQNQLLVDQDITAYFMEDYKKKGVEIIRGTYVHELINNGKNVTAIRMDGESIDAEYAFITLGFCSNLDNLKIQNANLMLNEYGSIHTNEYGQTKMPHIYVVGDSKTSASAVNSMAEAYVAVLHASNHEVEAIDTKTLPLSFNENPQVSTVGNINRGDPDITTITIPYDTRQYRAFMTGEKEGFLKIAFNKDKEIVGGTCIGSQAKDIITLVALMVKIKAKMSQVSTFFGSHPTATELPFILFRDSLLTIRPQ